MAPLGVRTKLARVHVLDHALAQRGDSLGCHRQLLSGMRLFAPPSSRQGASPATYDLAPGDNACRCARGRSLSRKRFSAMALGVFHCGAQNFDAIGGTTDIDWPLAPIASEAYDPKRSSLWLSNCAATNDRTLTRLSRRCGR